MPSRAQLGNRMPSANTLYALHTLEPGKRYVAFSPENDGTWLWEGRLLALTWNCELAVIEQRDDSLGVVWNWNFPEGVRANYHEVLPEEQLCDVPRINTGAEQAQRAAMLLMTIPGRSVASEPVSAL